MHTTDPYASLLSVPSPSPSLYKPESYCDLRAMAREGAGGEDRLRREMKQLGQSGGLYRWYRRRPPFSVVIAMACNNFDTGSGYSTAMCAAACSFGREGKHPDGRCVAVVEGVSWMTVVRRACAFSAMGGNLTPQPPLHCDGEGEQWREYQLFGIATPHHASHPSPSQWRGAGGEVVRNWTGSVLVDGTREQRPGRLLMAHTEERDHITMEKQFTMNERTTSPTNGRREVGSGAVGSRQYSAGAGCGADDGNPSTRRSPTRSSRRLKS